MLEVKNLSKSFGSKQILQNLQLQLEGKVYGLLAPNGAGKTTLLRCLTAVYPETLAHIYLEGSQVKSAPSYLAQIGYLPQKFNLFRELTASECLLLMAKLKGLPTAYARRRIAELLALVNLSTEAAKAVGKLSGGMVRRLGIAQALLNEPKLLFLDEPTSGLDPEERVRFKNIIEEIKKERLIVISTHIVEDVEAVCERILILKNGQIQCNASNQELCQQAAGKVYEIAQSELEQISGSYYISRKFEREGEIMLRLLSTEKQIIAPAKSSIEDGYLCVVKEI